MGTQVRPSPSLLAKGAAWALELCRKGVLRVVDEDGVVLVPLEYDRRTERIKFEGLDDLAKPSGLKLCALTDRPGEEAVAAPPPPLLRQTAVPSTSYRRLSCLGEGTFGRVYKAVDEQGCFWAVKLRATSAPDCEEVLRQEALWMRELSHPRLMPLQDALWQRTGHCEGIVMPLACCTLADRTKAYVSEEFLADCLVDIRSALLFLHARDLVHLDLKPLNVFVFGRRVKLGDLGSMQRAGEKVEALYACTRPYRPPEMLLGCARVFCAMDAWSFGVVALELAMQKESPFGASGVDQASFALALLGPPTFEDLRAMMAPWAEPSEADALAVQEAAVLFGDTADVEKHRRRLREQSLSSKILRLAEGLLCYDAVGRRKIFEEMHIPRPGRRKRKRPRSGEGAKLPLSEGKV